MRILKRDGGFQLVPEVLDALDFLDDIWMVIPEFWGSVFKKIWHQTFFLNVVFIKTGNIES